MRQIERDSDCGHTLRREPLITQIAIGPEDHSTRGEFFVKLLHARLKLATLDADIEIADAKRQKFLVLQSDPRGIGGDVHLSYGIAARWVALYAGSSTRKQLCLS